MKRLMPETDVGDTQCSEQLADVSVPQIADRIVEVVTDPRERIPERAIAQIVNMSRHTQWWRRSSRILSSPQQVANAQEAKIVSRQDPSVNKS